MSKTPKASAPATHNKHNKRLNISVQYACTDEDLPTRPQIRQWVRAAIAVVSEAQGGDVTVRIVDANEGKTLNHDYRGKDYATNVLSFPYENDPVLCGDLVICAEVVTREAVEQGKTLAAHYAHLIVHGMLHLQGYDHEESESEARIMENYERQVLAGLGYADPYADA